MSRVFVGSYDGVPSASDIEAGTQPQYNGFGLNYIYSLDPNKKFAHNEVELLAKPEDIYAICTMDGVDNNQFRKFRNLIEKEFGIGRVISYSPEAGIFHDEKHNIISFDNEDILTKQKLLFPKITQMAKKNFDEVNQRHAKMEEELKAAKEVFESERKSPNTKVAKADSSSLAKGVDDEYKSIGDYD